MIVLEWFCKMWQKDQKIRPLKSAQSLIVSFVKNVVLRRYASNRCAWMCHLSVLWQPATTGVEKNIWRPKNVSHFLLWMYSSMTRTSVRRYCNFLGDSLAVCHLYSSSFFLGWFEYNYIIARTLLSATVCRYCNFLGESLAVCHLYSSSFSWAGPWFSRCRRCCQNSLS